LGDLNDEWKEYTQNQIFAYAMDCSDYYSHSLAHVHPGMQLGNTRILIENI
jgi:hypothetical protein